MAHPALAALRAAGPTQGRPLRMRRCPFV